MTWNCPGKPTCQYEAHVNSDRFCDDCGLTEADVLNKPKRPKNQSWMPVVGAAILLLAIAGGSFAAYKIFTGSSDSKTPQQNNATSPVTPDTLVGETALNHPQLISQGEKLFLATTTDKKAGAAAFAAKNWDVAVSQYERATINNPNDPEAKIYWNNAKAKQVGNPLTMAVVLPINADPNAAQEVLRGVALKQDQFNKKTSGPLLEIALVNEVLPATAVGIAEDLSPFANLLGVMIQSGAPDLDLALRLYGDEDLAAISPLNVNVSSSGQSQSVLQLVPTSEKSAELRADYLESIARSAMDYAKTQNSRPAVTIFYNAQRDYSDRQRQALGKVLEEEGKLVEEINIQAGDFDAEQAVRAAIAAGANTIFLALNKEEVPEALAIARANKEANSPLTAIGGDRLYNPDILVEGGDFVAELVLAVPWRYEEKDDFASTALALWKGRVSWRTAAAYDVTQALSQAISQAGDRPEVINILQQGVEVTGSNADFEIFTRVPLVKAVEGSGGPAGSSYRFDPV